MKIERWMWDLLADIVDYEDAHGQSADGVPCLATALARVPDDIRSAAEVIAGYRREQAKP